MPFEYDWDNSLTAPLNWTYAPDYEGGEMPYLMYNAEGRLSRDLPDLQATTRIDEDLRITPFHGTIARSILGFYRPPEACLKIIDPQIDRFLPDKPRYFKEISPFSDLSLIEADHKPAAVPPLPIFLPEPAPDWCYYFQKAELARQTGEWDRVVALGRQAGILEKKFTRKNVFEVMPFIEAALRTGEIKAAASLSIEAHRVWENMRAPLCSLWKGIETSQSMEFENKATYLDIIQTLNCQEAGS